MLKIVSVLKFMKLTAACLALCIAFSILYCLSISRSSGVFSGSAASLPSSVVVSAVVVLESSGTSGSADCKKFDLIYPVFGTVKFAMS